MRAILHVALTCLTFLIVSGEASSQNTGYRELHSDWTVSKYFVLRMAGREESKGGGCYDDTVSGSHETVR